MSTYSLSHLSDQELLRRLVALVARDRATTAELVAHVAEVEARRLFAPKGYACMYEYCVRELHLPEDAAIKRIRVARVARQFPAVFAALAEGRLHLTAVFLLSRHLTAENGAELLAAAEHKSKAEIMPLAERFPQPDLPARLDAIGSPTPRMALPAPEQVEGVPKVNGMSLLPAPEQVAPAPWPNVAPLSEQRFVLQATIGQSAHDKLRYIQALLGHAVPSGDLAAVLERSFDAHITLLEKQKLAATSRPRARRASADPRHIPAAVKRAVWERDGGRCSFVGEGGHRCESRAHLEHDHVDPVARGGEATVEGIRLLCRAHNQYEAECVFGAGFMASKREAARLAAAEARARAAETHARAAEDRARAAREKREKSAAEARAATAEKDPERSVVPWLRQLGYKVHEAREAAALCENLPDATLEEKIKVALGYFRPMSVAQGRAGTSAGSAA